MLRSGGETSWRTALDTSAPCMPGSLARTPAGATLANNIKVPTSAAAPRTVPITSPPPKINLTGLRASLTAGVTMH